MKNTQFRNIAYGSVIAAVYVVLTYFTNLLGLANGVIQCRLSEALCILPFFTPAAVPGVFIGCFLSNLLTGCTLPDIIFGSLATLVGAYGCRLASRYTSSGVLLSLPTVIANTVIIPFVLKFSYGFGGGLVYFVVTVMLGELLSCTLLGALLHSALKKKAHLIFK